MKKNKKIILLILMIITILPEIVIAAEAGTEYLICDGKRIPAVIVHMSSSFMTLIKIAIPILLVISGMISFIKVTYSSSVEDEMKKAKTKLVRNILAASIIFFIFSIINFAVSLVAGANNNFMSCAKCFINDDESKCEFKYLIDEELEQGFINNAPEQEKEEPIRQNLGTDEPEQTPNTQTQIPSGKDKYKLIIENNGVEYMQSIDNPNNKVLIVNKTYSLPDIYKPSEQVTSDSCTDAKCFDPYTWRGYEEMYEKAKAEQGFDLNITSGYRSYSYQKILYNNYVQASGKEAADTFSARPGHSEHQTGLAMDIINASDSFIGTPQAKWLNDNCYKYGFIIRYPKGKESITGYKYEPWHIRFVGKTLAKELYNNGNWITLEEYFDLTSEYRG